MVFKPVECSNHLQNSAGQNGVVPFKQIHLKSAVRGHCRLNVSQYTLVSSTVYKVQRIIDCCDLAVIMCTPDMIPFRFPLLCPRPHSTTCNSVAV